MPAIPLPDRVSKKDRIFYKGMFVAANVRWSEERTVPLFGQVDSDKVVDMVINRECQTCGKRIARDQFVCFPGRFGLVTYAEAPLHIECARYALQVCPMILSVKQDFGVAVARDYQVTWGEATPHWARLPEWMRASLSLAHDPMVDCHGKTVCTTCGREDMGYMNYDEFMRWSAC